MGGEYIGVGVSAHSFMDGCRSWNDRDLMNYMEAVEEGRTPRSGDERLTPAAAMQERLWLGLRTSQGVELSIHELGTLTTHSRAQAMVGAGYLEFERSQLRLTSAGFAVADELSVDVALILEQAAAGSSGSLG